MKYFVERRNTLFFPPLFQGVPFKVFIHFANTWFPIVVPKDEACCTSLHHFDEVFVFFWHWVPNYRSILEMRPNKSLVQLLLHWLGTVVKVPSDEVESCFFRSMLGLPIPLEIILNMYSQVLMTCNFFKLFSHHFIANLPWVSLSRDPHNITFRSVEFHAPFCGPVDKAVQVFLKRLFIPLVCDGLVDYTIISKQYWCCFHRVCGVVDEQYKEMRIQNCSLRNSTQDGHRVRWFPIDNSSLMAVCEKWFNPLDGFISYPIII